MPEPIDTLIDCLTAPWEPCRCHDCSSRLADDPVMDFDPFDHTREQASTLSAYHEAGHAVATWALGLPLHEVQIKDRGGGHSDRVEDLEQLCIRLGRRDGLMAVLIITVAGGCSQRRLAPDSGSHGCQQDFINGIALAKRLASATGTTRDYVADATASAERILTDHWHNVERLAAELVERRTMTGAEVETLLGHPQS